MALLGAFPPSTVLTPPPFVPIKSTQMNLEGETDGRMVGQAAPKRWLEGGMEAQTQIAPIKLDSIKALLQRYKQLANHELYLVTQLKDQNPRSVVGQQLGRQLQLVLAQKMREVNSLVGDQQIKEVKAQSVEPVVASVVPAPSGSTTLEIIEQPEGNVVANKYLEPSLVLKISDDFIALAQDSRLQVTASLSLALGDKKISRTLDDKQEILQGHVCVLASSNGTVSFNKLKIMEVSSKYQHQAFCINFQLEEIKANNVVSPIGSVVKSMPLHVQSRVNKRKKKSLDGIESFNDSIPSKKQKREPSLSRSSDSITDELFIPPKPSGVATRASLRNSLGNGTSPPIHHALRSSTDEVPRPSSLNSSFGNQPMMVEDISTDTIPNFAVVAGDPNVISTRSRTRGMTRSQNGDM